MQAISCPFFGAVGAIVWLPSIPGLNHGFTFGCADGSIHIYTRNDTAVCHIRLPVSAKKLIIIVQSQYVYFVQEDIHDGPVLDLKFDPHFGRLASVGGHAGHSYPQVSQITATNGGKCGFDFLLLYHPIFVLRHAALASTPCTLRMYWYQRSFCR